MKNNLYWLQLESSIVDLKPCRICQKYSLHYAKETQICCSGEKKRGGEGRGIKSISHFTVEIKHKPMYLCLTISLTLLGYAPVKEDLINTKSIFDVCNTTA